MRWSFCAALHDGPPARRWSAGMGGTQVPTQGTCGRATRNGGEVKSGLGGESVILAAWGKWVDFGVGRHFRYLVIWSEPQRLALLSVPVGGAAVSKVYYCERFCRDCHETPDGRQAGFSLQRGLLGLYIARTGALGASAAVSKSFMERLTSGYHPRKRPGWVCAAGFVGCV